MLLDRTVASLNFRRTMAAFERYRLHIGTSAVKKGLASREICVPSVSVDSLRPLQALADFINDVRQQLRRGERRLMAGSRASIGVSMMDPRRRYYGSGDPPPWEKTAPLNTAEALVEIEEAIRHAFPNASRVTARADQPGVLVQFAQQDKPVSVEFSEETLKAYRHRDDALRLRAMTTLKLVCNCFC